jgi:glycerol-3-phosphate dehydrogenase subunit B
VSDPERPNRDALPSASVVVVGAGVAGTGAALAAAVALGDANADGGAARPTDLDVVLVDGGSGSSTLWTGAIDDEPWQPRADAPPPHAPPPDVRRALDALGAYVVGEAGVAIVTMAGLLRPARGRDAALLDVSAASPASRVAVARARRPGWDADALARMWGDGFAPIDAELLRYTDEEVVPDADFATRHDDDTRLGWLAGRVREALSRAGGRFSGVVMPPALGVDRSRAAELSGRVGLPCGEALGAPGGPAGLRFEAARDRALAGAGVRVMRGRVMRVARVPGGWTVALEDGTRIDAPAVVLAAGGLVGGGLEYTPAEVTLATALPPAARLPLNLTIEAPVLLGEAGHALVLPSSLFGVAPESIAAPFTASPLLERAGVLTTHIGAVVGPDAGGSSRGLYAAGEIVADAPRTWLAALAGGCRAGSAAARASVTAATGGSLARASDEASANPA